MIPLSWYLVVAFVLVGMGAYGMAVKRNLIRILVSAEIMGNGVSLALIAVALYSPTYSFTGQALVILIIAIAAAHTAIAMVLLLLYHRRYRTVDLGKAIPKEVATS
ncbi:MAG: NADH-quinone oxidoreductase subunit NuoK [Candidatus Thorarchaeota archaeon]